MWCFCTFTELYPEPGRRQVPVVHVASDEPGLNCWLCSSTRQYKKCKLARFWRLAPGTAHPDHVPGQNSSDVYMPLPLPPSFKWRPMLISAGLHTRSGVTGICHTQCLGNYLSHSFTTFTHQLILHFIHMSIINSSNYHTHKHNGCRPTSSEITTLLTQTVTTQNRCMQTSNQRPVESCSKDVGRQTPVFIKTGERNTARTSTPLPPQFHQWLSFFIFQHWRYLLIIG